MAHENFKRSPIFQNALRAPDTMWIKAPRACVPRWRQGPQVFDGHRVAGASGRLAHLIRNGLDLDNRFQPNVMCAMKAFLRHIDSTLPAMAPRVSAAVMHDIQAKIAFCRELIAASDQERAQVGYERTTAEWFEEKIARHQSTMHEVVYENPFWTQYCGQSNGKGIWLTLSTNNREFHNDMTNYWS